MRKRMGESNQRLRAKPFNFGRAAVTGAACIVHSSLYPEMREVQRSRPAGRATERVPLPPVAYPRRPLVRLLAWSATATASP